MIINNDSIAPQFNFAYAKRANSYSSAFQNAEYRIDSIMDNLCYEGLSAETNLTDAQSEAALIAYDEWRYLLHSVDGLGA